MPTSPHLGTDLERTCRFAAQGLLLGGLAAAPWMFGSVERWSQHRLDVAIASGAVLTAVMLVLQSLSWNAQTRPQPALPSLLIPAILALLLGTLQVIPFSLAERLHTGPLGQLAQGVGAEPTVSLYPALTRLELTKLCFAALTLLLSTLLFDTRPAQRCLFGLMAFNGAALTCFGLAQKISWNNRLFWVYELKDGGQPFASFVNRNNAAGYLNLCLAAAVGFFLWTVFRKREGHGRSHRHDHDRGDWQASSARAVRSEARAAKWDWRRLVLRPLVEADGLQVLALSLVALCVVGVMASTSRSGIGACVVSALGLGAWSFFRTERPSPRRWLGVVLVLGVLALAGIVLWWVGVSDQVGTRLATLTDGTLYKDARFNNWKDGLRGAWDVPWLGSGFGTYRYAYLPYQRHNVPLWFVNADNQYVEGLLEGGLPGLLLILCAVGLLAAATWRLLRSRGEERLTAAPGELVGQETRSETLPPVALVLLIAQPAQAVFDFGLTMPANLLLLAALCGAIGTRAAEQAERSRWSWLVRLPVCVPRVTALVFVTLLLAMGLIGLREVSAAAEAQALRPRIRKLDLPTAMLAEDVQTAIESRRLAERSWPPDAELLAETAELEIYAFRLKILSNLGEDGQWTSTEPGALHQRANFLSRQGDRNGLQRLRSAREVQQHLVPALGQLRRARAACPILPRVDLRIAALEWVDEQADPGGLTAARRAVMISPFDPEICFQAGLLAINAGDPGLARRFWKQGLEESAVHLPEAYAELSRQLPASLAWVDEVIPNQLDRLLPLAKHAAAKPGEAALTAHLVRRAGRLLNSEDAGHATLPPAERVYWRAVYYQLNGQPREALQSYRAAIGLRPEANTWRYDYARLLLQEGHPEEARRQTAILTRASPDDVHFRELHEEILAVQER